MSKYTSTLDNKLNILLVKDTIINRLLFSKLNVNYGYNVIQARDCEEALEMARNNSVDYILLDGMAPNLSSYEVINNLKTDPTTASIPVIMITDSAILTIYDLTSDAGVDAFFNKPVGLEDIISRIERLINRQENQEDSESDGSNDYVHPK